MIIKTFLIHTVTLPVWGVGLLIVGGGAVTLGATKGIQYLYENAMDDECK